MEHNCVEAIYNNVFGTQNLVELCEEYGAERFMMVSTDKAVNPTNVMGATKRMCRDDCPECKHTRKVNTVQHDLEMYLAVPDQLFRLFNARSSNGGPVQVTDKRIIRIFYDNSGSITACSSEWCDCQ